MMNEETTDAGALGAAEAHNLGDEGSIPSPATTEERPTSGAWARAMRTNRGANGGRTTLPPGAQWLSHDGTQARLRRFRQAWGQYEKLCEQDGYAKVTRERLLDYVAEMDVPTRAAEIAAHGLCFRARVLGEENSMSWTTALNRMLNELEEAEAAKRAAMVDPSVGVRVPVGQ